ncbi:Retrotransposon gag domain - like 10 [Theobroma cacao]|nr:Retrotransposon gag domain - like 10 [Theobroma cacao]
MADSSAKSHISPAENPLSSYYIHHSDLHGSVVINPKLTVANYMSWSRAFLIALSICKKMGFIDGTIKKPSEANSLFEDWSRCNILIVTWLLESLTPEIASNVLYMDSAKEILETLKNRFSQSYETIICNLQFQLENILQGTKSVNTYFTELNSVWQELKNFRPLPQCDYEG